MKFFLVTLVAAALSTVDASANFKNTVNTVNSQMSSLTASLAQLKATADRLGHRHISNKCNEASQYVGNAQFAWGGLGDIFGGSPWAARSSSHASQVQSGMSTCGSALDWIYGQPEISAYPDYQAPVRRCRRSYNSCQTGCSQVWNWPSPPGYGSQPSQYPASRRHRRNNAQSLCPNVQETACPISTNASGHECIDTQTEITSCGGCESLNEGENCLAIEGADEVGCELGQCRIFTMLPGYEMNHASGRPQPLSSA